MSHCKNPRSHGVQHDADGVDLPCAQCVSAASLVVHSRSLPGRSFFYVRTFTPELVSLWAELPLPVVDDSDESEFIHHPSH